MILVDTSFFIALAVENDDYHARAAELQEEIEESGESIVFSDSILGELATYLRRKVSAEAACREAGKLLEMHRATMAFPTQAEVSEALSLLGKYSFSSYTDALSLAMMLNRGIRKIVSFDSEFDRVKGITRIR